MQISIIGVKYYAAKCRNSTIFYAIQCHINNIFYAIKCHSNTIFYAIKRHINTIFYAIKCHSNTIFYAIKCRSNIIYATCLNTIIMKIICAGECSTCSNNNVYLYTINHTSSLKESPALFQWKFKFNSTHDLIKMRCALDLLRISFI